MGFMSSNSDMPSSMRGIISLVSAASMAYDDSLERIVGVKLVAVGRGKVSRVRAVKDGLLVADGWSPLFDNMPEASYKHQLYVRILPKSIFAFGICNLSMPNNGSFAF